MKKLVTKDYIYKKLTEKGFKITKVRKNIINIFFNSQGYLSVSNVAKKIPNANISSIYNNVWLLEKLKIINKIKHNSNNYFHLPFDPEGFNNNFVGYYINKKNKIDVFNIEEEVKAIKRKLEGHKVSKIKVVVSEE